jgi:dihydroflavonol-4-reductase
MHPSRLLNSKTLRDLGMPQNEERQAVNRRIFVTGGTGLLGNCIVRVLLERGMQVRVLCRKQTPRTPFEDLDVEVVEGELEQFDVLQAAVADCQAVIHSAAMIHIGWGKLEASRRINVQGTDHLVRACLASQARLLHISTVDTLPSAVDREHPISETMRQGLAKPQCTYVVSKSESEQVVERGFEQGLDGSILHPGFMLGPFDWKPSSGRMMLEVNRAPLVASPPGGCSVCDARDVAAAVVNAIDRAGRGEHYILAGENMSYRELWIQMLRTTGRRRHVYRLGKRLRWIGRGIDLCNRMGLTPEGDVNGASILMGSIFHYYDSGKAERELGYHRRPLEETLGDAWTWLSQRFLGPTGSKISKT